MVTRLVVSLTFVAFLSVPAAYAGGNCPFGSHYTTAQTADAQSSTPQSSAPATVVEAPVVAPNVTVAEAPAVTNETKQD